VSVRRALKTVELELRFYLERDGRSVGPVPDDEVRDAIRDGSLERLVPVRLAGTELSLPAESWATFALRREHAPVPYPAMSMVLRGLTEGLRSAPREVRELLLYRVAERGATFGPLTGEQLRRAYVTGRYVDALVAILHTDVWFPIALLFGEGRGASGREPEARDGQASPRGAEARRSSGDALVRCPFCCELIVGESSACPECDEPLVAARSVPPAPPSGPSSSGPPSIPDDPPDASWLRMHWRPLVTMGVVWGLIATGIALRTLAPDRFAPPKAASANANLQATCRNECWVGEACQLGVCTWQQPNDVSHVGGPAPGSRDKRELTVRGPFALGRDVSDVLPLDAGRFAVAVLAGTEIRSTKTGELVTLVSEAPQSKRLFRVGDVVYIASPERIHVLDVATTKVLKSLEIGSSVGSLTVAASGRRALLSLPAAHAVAVFATEYHAEIDRIQFGDDAVGPLAADHTGHHALVTTGGVPAPGLRDPAGGAIYAFDPSRLASQQDRVRSAMLGNPASAVMGADDGTAYVLLRAENAIVPLTLLASGGVRQEARVPTCREPEQMELVRRGRRAVVRCNEGRALEVLDLGAEKGGKADPPPADRATPKTPKLVKQLTFDSRLVDMALSPDARQTIVVSPAPIGEEGGTVAVVDLDTFTTKTFRLTQEPSRVRVSPDGSTAVVMSDRAKLAWVLATVDRGDAP
jgi:hypothetical protein